MSNSIKAAAKLNLYLHILATRADGYHTLESLVVFTDLTDHLSVRKSDVLSLEVTGEFAADSGNPESNLALKAAHALQQATNTQHGAHLVLEKNIPVGAGLGGGSADAAATLQLLNNHWQLALSLDELKKIGKKIGADVPMCLEGKPLIARSIGDELEPLAKKIPALHAVLVYPRKLLSTAHVYANFDHPPKNDRRRIRSHRTKLEGLLTETGPSQEIGAFFAQLASSRNDLGRPAISLMPEIAKVLLALQTAPGPKRFVRMSGSGACCFALVDNRDAAENLAAHIRTQYPGWWTKKVAISN
jgi:4-diphosphocytidyl-2-C-methyl-D-erythritol kinase